MRQMRPRQPRLSRISCRMSRRYRRLGAAGISNSTNVRLMRQKSTLFQWLAVPLWFPTDKNSVPTDSGAFRSQFCGREINAVLIVGGVPFEKAGAHTHHTARGPRRSTSRTASARGANDREPGSPLRAYWSVYELTHRTLGSRRAAGSRITRTECPNLLAHYFNLREPTVVRQAIETVRTSVSSEVEELACDLAGVSRSRRPGQQERPIMIYK